jgi:hypothetical protein
LLPLLWSIDFDNIVVGFFLYAPGAPAAGVVGRGHSSQKDRIPRQFQLPWVRRSQQQAAGALRLAKAAFL